MWSLPISMRSFFFFTFWTQKRLPIKWKGFSFNHFRVPTNSWMVKRWKHHVIWRLDGLLVDWLGLIQVEGVPPEAWRFRSQLHPTGDAFSWWQGLGRSYLESSNSFKFYWSRWQHHLKKYFLHMLLILISGFCRLVNGWWAAICHKLDEGTKGNPNQNHHTNRELQPTLQLSGGRTYSN